MKYFSLLVALVFSLNIVAQSQKVDPTAILLMDHMSEVIGGLEACSFEVSNSYDRMDRDYGRVKSYGHSKVIMVGPDKMVTHSEGPKGARGFWNNGKEVVFYSFTENNYAIIEAESDIIATIDKLHFDYGIDFPAADFFYPAFTDDMLAEFDTIKYIGKEVVENIECFHVKASNEKMDVQYWFANDIYKMPKKYVILYKDKDNMQYESTFENWELNPNIPDAVFEFTPPAMAREIKIRAKN